MLGRLDELIEINLPIIYQSEMFPVDNLIDEYGNKCKDISILTFYMCQNKLIDIYEGFCFPTPLAKTINENGGWIKYKTADELEKKKKIEERIGLKIPFVNKTSTNISELIDNKKIQINDKNGIDINNLNVIKTNDKSTDLFNNRNIIILMFVLIILLLLTVILLLVKH